MNTTVVITGASSGIGEALAYLAAKKKYNVVIASRSVENLTVVRDKCNAIGGKTVSIVCDVSIKADCENLIIESVKEFGRIDILINNAGITMRALLNDCDLSVIERVMTINFWGTAYCTKYALPFLLNAKGSVVGVSSIAGIKGLPARTGYSASKFAINGFLESLRIENMKTGLHVLIACPGYTASNTRNSALNKDGLSQAESPLDESKLMQPEVVAAAIFNAIEKRKSYLYLTFEGNATLFLSKFFPRLLDKLVFNKVAKETNSPFG